CKTLFHGTCEQKLADYLACVPMALTQTCLVGSPPAPSGPCSTTEDDLLDCLPCGDGEASMTGQRGCESNYSCGLMTSCDDDGFCTCVVAGELAATCRAVIGGIQACLPGTTCCGAFLQ
ncbi:MAG: hypothetical protein JNK04_12370, partial [Myxococcales bacterium]|nr:hypothetical protein [Myxococcales bacterium]